MKPDFNEIVTRRGSNSAKWDTHNNDDTIPMWIADMDFKTAKPIREALQKRVEHGVFGYAKVPDSYYEAIDSWFSRRYNFSVKKEWVLYTTGVVPALSAIIKALTQPGDNVLVQSPVYNCFFSSIRNNDCNTTSNNLIYKNDRYEIDYNDLEEKTADPKTKLLLLCNPHNPVGRVWNKEELEKVGEICYNNNVIVVSDEIHCDLVHSPFKHIPFASLGEKFLQNSITCCAPTKTFNIAGLQVANIITYDPDIREKIDNALKINEVCEINAFGSDALIAAYQNPESEVWLETLKEYLWENYETVKCFFGKNFPEFKVLPLEATYLVWIDCSALKIPTLDIANYILENEHVWINQGTLYGDVGEGFMRINIATRKDLFEEGLTRIKTGFEKLMKQQ